VPKQEFRIAAKDDTRRAVDSAKKNFSGLNKSIGSAKKGLIAFGAAVGVAKVFELTKETAAAKDELGKMAGQLGLTVEQLSRFQFVAERSGIKSTEFNASLQRMERRLAEVAATGKGEAVGALDALGVSIDSLKKLSPDEQFLKLSDAMDGVENPSEKVRIAFKLFDSGGVKMIRAMEGGSEAIRGLMRESDRLGGTLSTQAATDFASFNDSLTNLDTAFDGLKIKISSVVAKPLTKFFNFLAFAIPDAAGTSVKSLEELDSKISDLDSRIAGGEKSRGQRLRRNLSSLKSEREEIVKNQNEIKRQTEFRRAASAEQLRIHQLNLAKAADERELEREKTTADSARLNMVRKYQDSIVTLSEDIQAVTDLSLPALIEERAIDDLTGKYAAIQDATIEHQMILDGVHAEHIQKRNEYEKATSAQKTAFVVKDLSTITGAFAGQSKKMFEITKGLSIAETLINTYNSATSAYKAMVGIPFVGPKLAVVAAAAAIAAGKANVDQIRAQKFQGQAHDGLDFVPRTGTFLLERGERVVKKEDNKKLSQAIDNGLGSGELTVNFNISALDSRSATDYIVDNQNIIISIIQNAYTDRGRAGPLG